MAKWLLPVLLMLASCDSGFVNACGSQCRQQDEKMVIANPKTGLCQCAKP